LAQYDWGRASPAIHNGRDIVLMQARQSATTGESVKRDPTTVIRQRPPAEVDVLIDSEYGFLHRMTGLIDSEPFVVEELLDVAFDPPLDESAFHVDPSKFQVIDAPEGFS
jgi:hypothetical protein